MRFFSALTACLLVGCASRSQLHRLAPDDAAVDATVEAAPDAIDEPDVPRDTWGREVSGEGCATRPMICLTGDDFGPAKNVRATFERCTAEVGSVCGDLSMVFDDEGCLIALREISDYPPAFVDCVARVVGENRWQCAMGRTLRMLQGCAP